MTIELPSRNHEYYCGTLAHYSTQNMQRKTYRNTPHVPDTCRRQKCYARGDRNALSNNATDGRSAFDRMRIPHPKFIASVRLPLMAAGPGVAPTHRFRLGKIRGGGGRGTENRSSVPEVRGIFGISADRGGSGTMGSAWSIRGPVRTARRGWSVRSRSRAPSGTLFAGSPPGALWAQSALYPPHIYSLDADCEFAAFPGRSVAVTIKTRFACARPAGPACVPTLSARLRRR